jgi:hypothetical protein
MSRRPNKPRNPRPAKRTGYRRTAMKGKPQNWSSTGSGGNNDYGSQLSSVLKRGYGATLRSYPSTAAFAKVYLDPFSLQSARMPDFPVYPSTLVRIEQEFTMVANPTDGYGWALFAPLNMITSDISYGWYTNGSVVGAPPSFQTSGTSVSTATAPSQYLSSDFDSSSQNAKAVRCVAWGISVSNVSTNLNLAGKYYANQAAPRLTDSLINTNEETMQAFPTYKTKNAGNRKSFYYHRMITERSDLRYNQYDTTSPAGWIYSDDESLSSERTAYIGLWIRANGLASSETVIVRVCGHFEIVGQTRNVPGLGLTKSDTSGLEKTVSHGAKLRSTTSADTEDHISGKSENQKDSIVHDILSDTVDMVPIPKVASNLAHWVIDDFSK